MIVRAINVRQPWAALITRLPEQHRKTIENRTFRLRGDRGEPYTGPLLLVASASCSLEEYEDACTFAVWAGVPARLLPQRRTLELGGIVGAVHVTGYVEPHESRGGPWHVPENVGWRLERAIALPFRPYRGKQGPFRLELTPAEAAALRAARLAA